MNVTIYLCINILKIFIEKLNKMVFQIAQNLKSLAILKGGTVDNKNWLN